MSKKLFETDLKPFDVYETPNGNTFLKLSDDRCIAIGKRNEPFEFEDGDKLHTLPLNKDPLKVKKVGKIVFDK